MSEGGFPIPEEFQEIVLNYSALVRLEDEHWMYIHDLLKQGRRWEALAMANIELPSTTIVGKAIVFTLDIPK